ncbi:hypothetical protein [Stenotrophomonas sp. BIGb0135]|uniref:hypothetical protein n=1 Tax=Stenotrophomonas sp. BIGb0135 TaxID=2940620 RepID=UPI00216A7575|nr:hypothetical protein [Stenotrophomonas sp. BIGb0135]MCS4235071.1 hypothetical protein [Stenotrophomonas sp. BIGb0135]MCS4235126.1 hypothetical protein [Stenotrophomonas sp. BIGb0135]
MATSNVIQFRQRQRRMSLPLPMPLSSGVVDLAEHRRQRTGYPEGWPEGESGRKMEEMAAWAFEHSIEAGRHDTMRDARVRTMRMVASLQRLFEERRNGRG